MKGFLKSSYMALMVLFIYIPIAILILFSFNSGESMSIFNGFSDKWYQQLAHEQSFLQSIIVSIFTAVIATVASTVIGTFAAIGLSRSRKVTQKMTLSITNIPLINADIITAVALMMLFIAISANFGLLTLILAHISFDIPFVIMIVLPRLRKIDQRLIEASLDLGAKPSQTLRKIVLPILKPAIISAAAIAFAMSFDDFIISYFTGGDDVNVATFIYTMKRIKPFVNAFGTICIAIIGIVIVGWNAWSISKIRHTKFRHDMLKGTYKDKDIMHYEKRLTILYHQLNNGKILEGQNKEALRWKIIGLEKKYDKCIIWARNKKFNFVDKQENKENMNKITRKKFRWISKSWKPASLALICAGSIGMLTGVYIANNTYDLVFANWGSYITADLIPQFEKEYGVKVKYTVYDSNETLLNKLYTTQYDIMVPSDYMVAKLAQDGRLEKIDYTKLNLANPNFNILKANATYDGSNSPTGENKYFNSSNLDVEVIKISNPDFYQTCIVPNTLTPLNSKCFDRTYAASLNNGLLRVLNKNAVVIPDAHQNINGGETIVDYSLPYFWGEVSLVINPTESNIKFLQDIFNNQNTKLPPGAIGNYGIAEIGWTIDRTQYALNEVEYPGPDKILSNGISWDIFWKAAIANKRVALNNDYRNLFMLANEKNYFSVMPETQEQANQDFADLESLIKSNNVSLKNDELINAVGDGDFDFAFMYNGDAIYADQLFAQSNKSNNDKKLIITRPRTTMDGTNVKTEGTNIWSDNMVLSKNARNKDLAYKLMNFLVKHSMELTEETGYTSPYQQVMDYETNYGYYADNKDEDSGYMSDYIQNYIPVAKKDDLTGDYLAQPQLSDGPFKMTLLDQYVVNMYNILIASKN